MRRLRSVLVAGAAAASVVLVASPAVAQEELLGDLTIGSTTHEQGVALVDLTVLCSNEGGTVDFSASVSQSVGRTQSVTGFGYTTATCTNGTASATVRVVPYEGRFAGGPAFVSASAFACDEVSCDYESAEATRRLTGR